MSKDYYEEHKNDYFDYKGVRYYAGTKFKKRAYGDTTVDAVFTRRFGREFWFRYKFPGRSDIKIDRCSEKDFYDNLVEIINDSDISEFERKKHYLKESEVPEIVCGWIIYILVMCGITIFKHAWAGWIAVTIYFFRWKKKKLKEAYYYD